MNSSVAQRCCGAQRISTLEEGRGDTLNFPHLPDCMSGSFLNDIAGLDGRHAHPLAGAVFFTENNADHTFSVTIFQNDLKDLTGAFREWLMYHSYIEYVDAATEEKLLGTAVTT
jgi:hypothetical protein